MPTNYLTEEGMVDWLWTSVFKQVDFTYQPNTPFEQRALFDINLTIQDGSYTAIVGHTGSGKSTLLQHFKCFGETN